MEEARWTLKRFYRLALFLPFVMPILMAALCWAVTGDPRGVEALPDSRHADAGITLRWILSSINFLFWGPMLFGGIYYLMLVVFLLMRYGDHDAAFWGRMYWILPVVFAALLGVMLTLVHQDVGMFAVATLAIPYGYFYVFLIQGIAWGLVKWRVVEDG